MIAGLPPQVQEAYNQFAQELGDGAKIVVALDDGHWVVAGQIDGGPVYVVVVDLHHSPDRVDFLVDL